MMQLLEYHFIKFVFIYLFLFFVSLFVFGSVGGVMYNGTGLNLGILLGDLLFFNGTYQN